MQDWSAADVAAWAVGLGVSADWKSALVDLDLEGEDLVDIKARFLQKQRDN